MGWVRCGRKDLLQLSSFFRTGPEISCPWGSAPAQVPGTKTTQGLYPDLPDKIQRAGTSIGAKEENSGHFQRTQIGLRSRDKCEARGAGDETPGPEPQRLEAGQEEEEKTGRGKMLQRIQSKNKAGKCVWGGVELDSGCHEEVEQLNCRRGYTGNWEWLHGRGDNGV